MKFYFILDYAKEKKWFKLLGLKLFKYDINDTEILGHYFTYQKRIIIYILPHNETTERKIINKITKTICHEYIHYCIDKIINEKRFTWKGEENIIGKMGG